MGLNTGCAGFLSLSALTGSLTTVTVVAAALLGGALVDAVLGVCSLPLLSGLSPLVAGAASK